MFSKKAILFALSASLGLLAFYFSTVTLVSGWSFAQLQFSKSWYFVISYHWGSAYKSGYTYILETLFTDKIPLV